MTWVKTDFIGTLFWGNGPALYSLFERSGFAFALGQRQKQLTQLVDVLVGVCNWPLHPSLLGPCFCLKQSPGHGLSWPHDFLGRFGWMALFLLRNFAIGLALLKLLMTCGVPSAIASLTSLTGSSSMLGFVQLGQAHFAQPWASWHPLQAGRTTGLQPEKEKPGVLPADVFVPSLAGVPTALDVAVTAPQRPDSLQEASQHPTAVAATAYTHKPRLTISVLPTFVRIKERAFCLWWLKARELGPLLAAARSGGDPCVLYMVSCAYRRRRRAELAGSGPSDPIKPAAGLPDRVGRFDQLDWRVFGRGGTASLPRLSRSEVFFAQHPFARSAWTPLLSFFGTSWRPSRQYSSRLWPIGKCLCNSHYTVSPTHILKFSTSRPSGNALFCMFL